MRLHGRLRVPHPSLTGHKQKSHGRVPAEYEVEMTVGGVLVGRPDPFAISWPRPKEPAATPIEQRQPTQLMVQLPANPIFLNPGKTSYAKFTIPKTLREQRPDQTWGIKVGTHKVKSRFDGGAEIDVTISRL